MRWSFKSWMKISGFATPNGSDGQLERHLKKEADRPPKSPRQEAGVLRRRLRWRNRAKEIGAVPPDPALQLKGLLKMSKKQLESQREL